ncbi:hypothetical protein HN51_053863 [Arachis hypogaea]
MAVMQYLLSLERDSEFINRPHQSPANLVSLSPSSSLSAAWFLLPAVTASPLTSPCSEFINRPHQFTSHRRYPSANLVSPSPSSSLWVVLLFY